MTRRPWILVALGAAVAVLAVASVAATGAYTPVLVVEDGEGEELLAVPVDEGTEVTLAYTHSVERTPVSDVYVVDDGGLVMDRTEYRSFGAGLRSEAPVEREGDAYVYRPDAQRHRVLTVQTGHVAGHDLVVDGERYDLSARTDGGLVHLRVERRVRIDDVD